MCHWTSDLLPLGNLSSVFPSCDVLTILETVCAPQDGGGVKIPDVLVPFMGGITYLPFVRDSKIEDGGKSAKAAAPAPIATPSAPVAASTGVARDELSARIIATGEELRAKKAEKADKAVVQGLVDSLLSLKLQFKENGFEYGSSTASSTAAATPSAPVAAASPVVQVAAAPATRHEIPAVVKPEYTSPPPIRKTKDEVSVAEVLDGDRVILDKLDARLRMNSYVGGSLPTDDDKRFVHFSKFD